MNNNIQESYCSYEVSKLLKEKGFGVPNQLAFTGRGITHALAIEWVRVNFGIWIFPDVTTGFEEWTGTAVKKGSSDLLCRLTPFNSPQEATEAALLYVLNNLI